MSWSTTFLNLLRAAASNPRFQQAAVALFRGIGEYLKANAGNPERITRFGQNLSENAPAVVGAIAKGTAIEDLVEPPLLQSANEFATMQGPTGSLPAGTDD